MNKLARCTIIGGAAVLLLSACGEDGDLPELQNREEIINEHTDLKDDD
ncbi:hypothetical protein [Bacillus sp. FJAT-45350]|nr:hypothetical protein [Bacillus sp. FJAT-45350]